MKQTEIGLIPDDWEVKIRRNYEQRNTKFGRK